MQRLLAVLWLLFTTLDSSFAKQRLALCGSSPETSKEQTFLHRQALKARLVSRFRTGLAAAPESATAVRDIGNIAVMDDSDGVVSRRNDFNLDRKTVAFNPVSEDAAGYRFQVSGDSYDTAAADAGAALIGLEDDDTRAVRLPFAFPYFGRSYDQVFVNSDGNLTFGDADVSDGERSLGRMVAGNPRIAILFSDLDPSKAPGSVRVTAEAGRLVVSWVNVPEYSDAGFAPRETFQVSLFPGGRIELAYGGVNTSGAVVGISPGKFQGSSTVLSFSEGSPDEFSSTVAERFGGTNEIDIETVAQNFYRNHDDAYDYLVIYNNLGIHALPGGVIAFEQSVRRTGTGYGKKVLDQSAETGSSGRLQALMNMGYLSQYPRNIGGLVPGRSGIGDTPLSVLAHEAGHLFLAYVSVHENGDLKSTPMLGFQGAHWNFLFNSEASLLEGNRILDNGSGAMPRFVTTATVEGYSPLDQYLMGFRPPEDVPPTFYVANSIPSLSGNPPQKGFSFDGDRRDVNVSDIIQAAGRRTPDASVSQRHFRFAFIVITRKGVDLSTDELDQVDTYRTQFETYYRQATSQRAYADTALRRSLQLSLFPAAGVVLGAMTTAGISIQSPATDPLTIHLDAPGGVLKVPDSVTIAAGDTSVSFPISGMRAGVEELTAQPGDSAFDTVYARVQVSPASSLKIMRGPMPVSLTDENGLPYTGMPLPINP